MGRQGDGPGLIKSAFTQAVDAQARALGFDPAVIYVPHPIQNRTADELKKIADDVVEPALKLLSAAK